MDIHARRYSSADACRIANVQAPTLKSWFNRGLIVGHREIEGGGERGRNRRYTYHNIMEIALAKSLIDSGMDLSAAFHAAQQFSHGGERKKGFPERDPGFPFHYEHGVTLFGAVKQSGRSVSELWNPAGDGDAYGRLRRALQPKRGEAMIVLDMTDFFDGVCVMCGYHPNEVLDQEYQRIVGDD